VIESNTIKAVARIFVWGDDFPFPPFSVPPLPFPTPTRNPARGSGDINCQKLAMDIPSGPGNGWEEQREHGWKGRERGGIGTEEAKGDE